MSADNTFNADELMRALIEAGRAEGVQAVLRRGEGEEGAAESRAGGNDAGEWLAHQLEMMPNQRESRIVRALVGDFGEEEEGDGGMMDVEMEEQAGGAGHEGMAGDSELSMSELIAQIREIPQEIIMADLRAMFGMEEAAEDGIDNAENPIEAPRLLFGNQQAAEDQEDMDFSDSGESIRLHDEPMEEGNDGEGMEGIPEDDTMGAEESGSEGGSQLVQEHMNVDEEPGVEEETDNYETAPESSIDYDTGDDGMRDEAFMEHPNESSSSESAAVAAARSTASNRPIVEGRPEFAIPALPARLRLARQHHDSSNDGDVSGNTTGSTASSQLSDGSHDVAFVNQSAEESSTSVTAPESSTDYDGVMDEAFVEPDVDVEGPATHSRLATLNEPSTSSDRRAKKRPSTNDDDDAPIPKRARFEEEEDEEEEDAEGDIAFLENVDSDEDDGAQMGVDDVNAPEHEVVDQENADVVEEEPMGLANPEAPIPDVEIDEFPPIPGLDYQPEEDEGVVQDPEEHPVGDSEGEVGENGDADMVEGEEEEEDDGEGSEVDEEDDEEAEVAANHVNVEDTTMADRLRQELRNLVDQDDIDCCVGDKLTKHALYAGLMEEVSVANGIEDGVVLLHPDVFATFSSGQHMPQGAIFDAVYFRDARWILIPMLTNAGTQQPHWSIACCNLEKRDVVVFDSNIPMKSVKDQRLAVLRAIFEECIGQLQASHLKYRYALRNRCVQEQPGQHKDDGIFTIVHARRYLRGALDVSNRGEDCDITAERQRLVLMLTSLRTTLQGYIFRPMATAVPTFHLPPPPQPQQPYHVVRRDHVVTQQRIRDCYRRLHARA